MSVLFIISRRMDRDNHCWVVHVVFVAVVGRSVRCWWFYSFNQIAMIYTHGKHEIELFDSIQNLPVLRFQRFNKYQMQSVEIGSTFEDYDQRTVKAMQFLKKGMKDEAIQELENRRQTVFNAFNDFTPVGRSFAILVKRIDSRDYSKTFAPDDLDRVLQHLEKIGLPIDTTIEKLSEVKKKSKRNWWFIFQSFFQKAETDNKPD